MSEERKASEVLLEIESKINSLLNMIRALDLNVKIISNKLNNLENKTTVIPSHPKASIEAPMISPPLMATVMPAPVDDPERAIFIEANNRLQAKVIPEFARTARPDTYDPNSQPAPRLPPSKPENAIPRAAIQVPTVFPPAPPMPPKPAPSAPNNPKTTPVVQSAIPVEQRMVNANNKAFMIANVEIIDLSTGNQVYKGRTNGAGKWMAPLPVGSYQVKAWKTDMASNKVIEAIQTIKVDGSQSTLTLPIAIVK